MTKERNAVGRFFASVKLALISLIVLAATSIIGTLIEQGKAPSYYVEEYGPDLARLFQLLDLPDMYSSWWYLSLLALFAINLVACSIERLPSAWRMVVHDNLKTDPAHLEKMTCRYRAVSALPTGIAAEKIRLLLASAGWKRTRRLVREESTLLFAQKGAWTRLGVYVVHLSILVILAGAMIGKVFGFKAYVFLPEGRSTERVFLQGSAEPVPLGFELYCDRFEKSYYPNGMAREYRSDLTVIDAERNATLEKSVIVNDPLSYRGITFYQGDSFPLQEFFVEIRDQTTGRKQAFRVPPEVDVPWPGTDMAFRIDELRRDEDGTVHEVKIGFTHKAADPAVFWINNGSTANIAGDGEALTLSFRQLSSTLLLATKDPGVWVVYLGCALLIIGLGISFCLSHQRLWVHLADTKNEGSRILISGTSNKHQPAFEGQFQDLIRRLEQDDAKPISLPNSRKLLKDKRMPA